MYLIIIILLLLFFMYTTKSSFSPIDIIDTTNDRILPIEDNSIYNSRIEYPYNPPVNTNIKGSFIINKKIPSSDLYSNLAMVNGGKQLSPEPMQQNINELNYSGGSSTILEIPLQYNYPTNEILRSQKILITDYNKNKYCF